MNDTLAGPDLTKGVAVSALVDGSMLLGHAQGEPVLLIRRGDEFFAIGTVCTHYGAPLADGLLVGDTVRCPWHHACFSPRTGDALRAPALDPVSCWHVEHRDGSVYVGAIGHAERWDAAEVDGQLDADTQDCTISYRRGYRTLAVAVVRRDLLGLNAEVAFERAG